MNTNKLIESSRYRIDEFNELQKIGLIPLSGEFYPAGVHYPPITMYPNVNQQSFFDTYSPLEYGVYDIYVHIPFCKKKCWFCHYPSKYSANETEKDQYLDALEHEMLLYTDFLNQGQISARSVLIGGGTPTDLSPKQLHRFLSYFTKIFNLSNTQQFNYDVDPITLVGNEGIEKLKILKDFGVDRLTIGVQSLDDSVLTKMNRSHSSEIAYKSIENSKLFKFQTNIEFIFGHPGQTLENWISVLENAINTGVEEIQMYRLKIYPYGDQEGSVYKYKDKFFDEFVTPENTILMKEIAIQLLHDNGYSENLRRVFTKNKKYISKYAFNQCCLLKEEIGFGLTAFSSLKDRFGLNTQDFSEYYSNIINAKLPINRGLIRDVDQQIKWAIILPLKNYWINKKIFTDRTGYNVNEVFKNKFELLRKYKLISEETKRILLTDKGAFFADEVATQFEDIKYLPFSMSEYSDSELNPYKNIF
ncbi:MAG: radical SAM protein [Chlorobiaceae bacterium]